MKIRGFSLIELMVVIAIVALISTIAVPAYKDYVAKATASEIVNRIESIKNAQFLFYAKYGKFPSRAELGLNAGGTYSYHAATNSLGDDVGTYLNEIVILNTDVTLCDQYGGIDLLFNQSLNGNFIWLRTRYLVVDGVIKQFCVIPGAPIDLPNCDSVWTNVNAAIATACPNL